MKTKYLLADVSLGVGVASLALGAYFFLASTERTRPARAARLDVQASTTSVGASYGGAF